jgi:hypothetical protein
LESLMDEPLDPLALARLHDEARRRAQELRREAIGELMDELGRALDRAADRAGRASRRWAQARARHQRLRQTPVARSVET